MTFLEVRGISKSFGPVQANDDISLSVMPGEVHTLLGENGAGKSTLVTILAGLYQPDAGRIFLEGKEVIVSSARVANQLGIGVVHQHNMLVPNLSVTENIMLAQKGRYRETRRQLTQQIGEVAQAYNFQIRPDALVRNLTVSEKQRVEIIKILVLGTRLFIFDEPTSALTPQEAKDLLRIMRQLTDGGHAVIFITHKLDEALSVSDRITILRQGRLITTLENEGLDRYLLAQLMVGREVAQEYDRPDLDPHPFGLVCENLYVRGDDGSLAVRGLTLSVNGGEIVGVCGVGGNGQQQLAEAVAGVRSVESGRVLLNSQDITHMSPYNLRKKMRLGVIPGDRQAAGTIMEMSVAENLVSDRFAEPPLARFSFVDSRAVYIAAEKLRKEYDVRTHSLHQRISELSGGNQQKVILARVLSQSPRALVAVFPTLGLDIGAMEYVHHELLEQRTNGAAVLLISTDLDEIFALSDRIAVMFEGKIQAVVSAREANVQKIGALMAGIPLEQANATAELWS